MFFILKVRNFNPEIVTAQTSKSCLSEPGTLSLASTSTTVSQTSELPSPASTALPVSPSSEIHTQLQSLPALLDTDTPRKIAFKRKIGILLLMNV
jgi:hypothetical protein